MSQHGSFIIERFWCPPAGSFALDDHGYLADPYEMYLGLKRNPDVVPTNDLAASACLVMLGEPGSGKSTILKHHGPLLGPDREGTVVLPLDLAQFGSEDRLVREVIDGQVVNEWIDADHELCLVIDSFDEGHAHIPTLANLLASCLSRWPCERLLLRIACRTADWPATLSRALNNRFDTVSTLELLPLRRRDVRELARQFCDPEEFIAAVERAAVVPLASRPLTLRLLASALASTGRLPERAADIYELGLRALCDESNESRRDSGLVGALSTTERLAVARRLGAIASFGDRQTIWTGVEAAAAGDLSLGDCSGGEEPIDGARMTVTAAGVSETLRTGLFSSRGAQRQGWAHATFGDFLAASWVIANDVAAPQIKSLLVAPDGRLFPQTRLATAWLVAIDPDRFGWLVHQDPEAFRNVVNLP